MSDLSKADMAAPDICEYVDIDGQQLWVKIRSVQHGSGAQRPLLLLNHCGGGADALMPLVNALSEVETIVVDLPGSGGSKSDWRPHSVKGRVSLLVQLLDRLGYCQPVDVLGIGVGGWLAQQLAIQAPQRCARLLLVATTSGAFASVWNWRDGKLLLDPQLWSSKLFSRHGGRLLGGAARQKPERLAALQASQRATFSRGRWYQVLGSLGWSSLPWLYRLPQPTLVLCGDDDPLVPVSQSQVLTWLIPNSRLHVVKGGGHWFATLRPFETAGLIRGFLAQAPGSPLGSPLDSHAATLALSAASPKTISYQNH